MAIGIVIVPGYSPSAIGPNFKEFIQTLAVQIKRELKKGEIHFHIVEMPYNGLSTMHLNEMYMVFERGLKTLLNNLINLLSRYDKLIIIRYSLGGFSLFYLLNFLAKNKKIKNILKQKVFFILIYPAIDLKAILKDPKLPYLFSIFAPIEDRRLSAIKYGIFPILYSLLKDKKGISFINSIDKKITKEDFRKLKDLNLLIIFNQRDEIVNIGYPQIQRVIKELKNKVIIVDYKNIIAHETLLSLVPHVLKSLRIFLKK